MTLSQLTRVDHPPQPRRAKKLSRESPPTHVPVWARPAQSSQPSLSKSPMTILQPGDLGSNLSPRSACQSDVRSTDRPTTGRWRFVPSRRGGRHRRSRRTGPPHTRPCCSSRQTHGYSTPVPVDRLTTQVPVLARPATSSRPSRLKSPVVTSLQSTTVLQRPNMLI